MENSSSPKIMRVEDLRPQLTLGKIVELIEINHNLEDVVYFKNKNRVLLVFDGLEETSEILVHLVGPEESRSRQGIHLVGFEDLDDLGFRLSDSIESCFRDGFEDIFIHDELGGPE